MTELRGWGRPVWALVFAATALGVAVFWVDWFASGKYLNAGDVCYRVFENTFPLPDGVMAVLMLLTAGLLIMGSPWCVLFGLISAGMSMHLGAIDLVYHLQQDNMHDWNNPETWSRAFIAAHTLLLGTLAAVYFYRRRRVFLGGSSERVTPPSWHVAAVLITVEIGFTCIYWYTQLTGDHAGEPACARDFHQACLMADTMNVLTGAAAIAGIYLRRAWALVAGLLHVGLALFGTLIYAAFSALNPDLIENQQNAYSILLVLFLFYILYLGWAFWRHRARAC
jgi:hypothetical protein